ncbi:28S ribosomal protein S29, mitochondrial [Anguilla rostrata]|uniref:28S ribosomal protein S29, mitochondrial n=1 Tax=Anguilla rostrata TaxID=7938 RepID=UPI0030D60916
MALHRLSLRLRQTVTQTRSLHGSGWGQQLGSAAVEPEPPVKSEPAFFRTAEGDPAHHSEHHLGQHYTLPPATMRSLFPHGLPPRFQLQVKTFNECSVMVREPAVEIISHLKRADYSKPAIRYLLYGERGSGKTMSLCHAMHYCYNQGWMILHIPDAHLWVKNCSELHPSAFHSSRYDQPIQAVQWLRNFRVTNEHFLSKIKTTRRYMWTKRESTEEGQPLKEIVEHGLSRVKSSCDVVGALLRELRLQAGGPEVGGPEEEEGQKRFRLAVAVDGTNALWGRTTLKKEDKTMIAPEELTLVHNLRKMLKNDWCGGAIITALSQTGSLFKPTSAYLPQELLGEEGFVSLEPFLPVPVPVYGEKEFESCYQYYIDRNWLQHPQSRTEEGKKEIIFLSNRNPAVLERLCASL